MSKSPRSKSYEDYWKEFKDIASSTDGENEEEETTKTPDEGEEEAAWLKDAGYDFVVSHITGGRELTDEEIQGFTATLTTSQAAVVRRRVNSLSATFRAKQKHKIDVREIFPEQSDGQWGTTTAPHTSLNSTDDVTGNVVHRRTKPSLHKLKGEYSMSGRRNEVLKDTNAYDDEDYFDLSFDFGIETLSMQPKGTFNKYMGPSSPEDRGRLCAMPSISDEDIEFELKLELETKNTMQTAGLESEDELPNFRVVPDKLGLTTMGDLSAADMEQIKSLALIELTSLLEKHDIIYHRQKGKKKAKENGIFGVPLQTLLDHDQKTKPNQTVPLVFEEMIKFMEQHCLEHEGVLRIPGSTARVKQLRKDLEDKFYADEFSWDDVLPHDVAALMKQFLRELPYPLLTHQYIEAFAQIENIKEEKKFQLKALNLLILLLPPVNRNTLKLLLELLLKITQRRQKNLMGLSNVAMIMAPNLFLSPSSRSKSKAIRDMEISMAAGTSNIVMMLIKYQKIIWTVPSNLLQQMRHQNDMENQKKAREKSIMKFLRKDKSDIYKKPAIANEGDFEDGVIRVQAPCLTKSSAAVKLYEETTACDIIDKFRTSNFTNNGKNKKRKDNTAHGISNFAETDAHLFEVGGNIGERCLHPQTNMLALYQINPNAEWIIRSETVD